MSLQCMHLCMKSLLFICSCLGLNLLPFWKYSVLISRAITSAHVADSLLFCKDINVSSSAFCCLISTILKGHLYDFFSYLET